VFGRLLLGFVLSIVLLLPASARAAPATPAPAGKPTPTPATTAPHAKDKPHLLKHLSKGSVRAKPGALTRLQHIKASRRPARVLTAAPSPLVIQQQQQLDSGCEHFGRLPMARSPVMGCRRSTSRVDTFCTPPEMLADNALSLVLTNLDFGCQEFQRRLHRLRRQHMVRGRRRGRAFRLEQQSPTRLSAAGHPRRWLGVDYLAASVVHRQWPVAALRLQ
jgi:hypothetical protein